MTKLILSCKDLVTSPDFRERKREGGKKISSKKMGEMGLSHYNRLSWWDKKIVDKDAKSENCNNFYTLCNILNLLLLPFHR